MNMVSLYINITKEIVLIPRLMNVSLKENEIVYPAAGDEHSAVELSIKELEDCVEITDWVDVNTEPELLATLTPLTNKDYYTLDTNKIWRYIEGYWKDIIYINFTKETNKINFKTEIG